MIDTIVLSLTSDTYQINEPDKFKPSAHVLLAQNKEARIHYSSITSKQNGTKKELLKGIYKPHLTLAYHRSVHGAVEPLLKVELSLPKLLYGNNFNELQYKDFKTITNKLAATLATMGIIVAPETLTYAPVVAIHYSKNVPLTDGSTPYHYINKIKEANVRLSLDTNQTDYRNEGHSYKWHSNAYEVVFYDKIRDLEQAKKSDKRSMEKDNAIQLHLYDALHNKKMFEVLRMEARLNNRRKIQQVLKKLNIKAQLTFKGLFKTNIARKVLLHYLDEIERARPPLLDFKANNTKSLLVTLIFNNPTLSPRRILQLYGMKLALEHMSIRELRTMFGTCNKRSWYRLIADMKDVTITQQPISSNPFQVIRDCLMTFKAMEKM